MLSHQLRHRVTFQRQQEPDRDANGNPVPGSGEVLTGAGREWTSSGAVQSETSARINLRWFPAADEDLAAWRVLWDGRTYNIQSAETDATARREWRLRCVDGPPER